MSNANIDYRVVWESYAAIWKLEGATAKRAACEEPLSPECVYVDPLAQLSGWDELVGYMVEFHKQIPGGHFVTTDFLAHHGRSLAHWNMVGGDGTVLGVGASFGAYSEDGKLLTMNGFFEPPPSPR